MSVIMSIVAVICVLGNLLVIVAVRRQRFLRTLPNMFIVSLAVADLLMGILVIPFSISQALFRYWPFGLELCRLYKLSTATLIIITLSLFHLAAISMDRYLTLRRGVQYLQGRTVKKNLLVIGGLWAGALIVGTAPLFGWANPEPIEQERSWCIIPMAPGHIVYVTFFGILLPMTVTIIAYIKFFLELRRSFRRKRETGINMPQLSSSSTEETNPRKQPNTIEIQMYMNKEAVLVKKERRAAIVLGMAIGVCVVCWLPFVFTYLLFLLPEGQRPEFITIFLTGWLGLSSSAWNPFIYTAFSPDFRKAFRKVLSVKTTFVLT
jgi:hypothetical protein